jgi:hypothetical protein
MILNEKTSIEETIDESEIEFEAEWVKYIACLCKNCGAEPGEPHTCKEEED